MQHHDGIDNMSIQHCKTFCVKKHNFHENSRNTTLWERPLWVKKNYLIYKKIIIYEKVTNCPLYNTTKLIYMVKMSSNFYKLKLS